MNSDETLKTLLKYFNDECEKITNNYNPHIKHFNVGDIVYYIPNIGDIITAEIESIDDFTHDGKEPGGMIYYWITPNGCKVSIFKKIQFWLNLKFPKWIKYFPPSCFPGHSVAAGEDIFKTQEEAELYLNLNHCYYNLHDYIDKRIKSNIN